MNKCGFDTKGITAKRFVQNLAVMVEALQVVNLSTGRKLVWSLDVYVLCFGKKTGL